MSQESEVLHALSESLGHVSRQRIRYMQMELRKYSTDARMRNEQRFLALLENNGVRLPQRTEATFLSLIRDQRGINVEAAAKYLKESQKRTRRDSVEALTSGEIVAAERKSRQKSARSDRKRGVVPSDYKNHPNFRKMTKRLSIDEFRRVGRLVANASTLTGKMRDLITNEEKNGTDLIEETEDCTAEDAQSENLLQILLQKQSEELENEPSSSSRMTEYDENDDKQMERRMDYLIVPQPEKRSLPNTVDPLAPLNTKMQSPKEDTQYKQTKKSKSKKKSKSLENCVITITVEDVENSPSVVCDEEKVQLGIQMTGGDDGKIVDCTSAQSMPESTASQSSTCDKESVTENTAEEPQQETCITDSAETGKKSEMSAESQVSIEAGDNFENNSLNSPTEIDENDDGTEKTNEVLVSNEASSPVETESTPISNQKSEKYDDQPSPADKICESTILEVAKVDNGEEESKNKEGIFGSSESLNSEQAQQPNESLGQENDEMKRQKEENKQVEHQEHEVDYSTDSFVTDDASEVAGSSSQSSWSDEEEEKETELDTRSIADFGGEDVSVGNFMVTMYPPEWYHNKEITDIWENKAATESPHLEVEWVYGCETAHSQSLATVGEDEIIYGSGCIVVLYNHSRDTQRQYLGHSGPISCVAVHPDQSMIGSAQGESFTATNMINVVSEDLRNSAKHESCHGRIHIRVWNVSDLETLYVMGVGSLQSIVRKMQFMKYRNFMITIEDDEQSSLTLWDAGCKLKKVATVQCPDVEESEKSTIKQNKRRLKKQESIPRKPDCSSRALATTVTSAAEFAIAGKEHLGFWKIKDIECLSENSAEDFVKIIGPLRGDFLKQFRPRYVTCCVNAERHGTGCYVSGDTNGTILVWSEERKEVIAAANHAHECPIACITVTKVHIFSCGATDRSVSAFAWGKDELDRVGRISLPDNVGKITAISLAGVNLFVATNSNQIVTVRLNHSAYSFQTLKNNNPTEKSKGKLSGKDRIPNPEQLESKNIFGRWEPIEIAWGSKSAVRCACTSVSLKMKIELSRQSTPIPVEINARKQTKSARARSRNSNVHAFRPTRSARPYKPKQNLTQSERREERSQTPDVLSPLTSAFSSPKLRTSDRVIQREQAKMCKENKVPALLFAQNNYIEKEIFSTSVFPKGIDSSPSIHEDALKVVKEYLWTASDGWIAVYDTNEHRVVGRMKLPDSYVVVSMDCSSSRSLLSLGCSDGTVILIRVNVDGFEIISKTVYQTQMCPSKAIKIIRFSNNGKRLAFTLGKEIILNSVKSDGLHEIDRYGGHASENVVSLDWSSVRLQGAELLRSCSLIPEPEILVWSTETSQIIDDLSTLRNITWHATSNPLDFAVKGLWDNYGFAEEVNCLALAHFRDDKTKENNELSSKTCSDGLTNMSSSQQSAGRSHPTPNFARVCCVGDASGCVRCYYHPCIAHNAKETVARTFHSALKSLSCSGLRLIAASESDGNLVQFTTARTMTS